MALSLPIVLLFGLPALLGSVVWVVAAFSVLTLAGILANRPFRRRRTFASGIRNLARTSGLTLEEAEILFHAAEQIQPIADRPFPGGAGVCREWLASYLRAQIFRGTASCEEMLLAADVATKIDPPRLRPPGSIDVVRSLDPVELSFPFLNLCLPGCLGLLEGRKLGIFISGSWPARGLELGDRVVVRAREPEMGSRWIRSGVVINYLGGGAPYVEIETEQEHLASERRDDFRVECDLPVEVFPESVRLEELRVGLVEAGMCDPAGRRRGLDRATFREVLEGLPEFERGRSGTARNFSVEGMLVECDLLAHMGDVILVALDWPLDDTSLTGLLRCRVVRCRRDNDRHFLHLCILDLTPDLRACLFRLANRLRRGAEAVEA
ncbi:MAG: PilZ domain-containing protein [Planctomycetota bacterium]